MIFPLSLVGYFSRSMRYLRSTQVISCSSVWRTERPYFEASASAICWNISSSTENFTRPRGSMPLNGRTFSNSVIEVVVEVALDVDDGRTLIA